MKRGLKFANKERGILSGWLHKSHRFIALQKNRILGVFLIIGMILVELPPEGIVFAAETVSYGDVNRDTLINEVDVSDLKKYLAEYAIDIDTAAADVNADGIINLQDLLLLEQYVAGLDVILGKRVTVTFDTNGGSAVEPIHLCKGATLSSVVDKIPTTNKEGNIFTGWKTSTGEAFYAEDVITQDITVIANFDLIPIQETLNISSFSLEDQTPELEFKITTGIVMTPEEVKAKMSLLSMDGTEPVGLVVMMESDYHYTVKADGGFREGASYQLTLAEGLFFQGKEGTIRTANFTIHKDEIDQLSYRDDVIYIQDTDSMSYMLDGSQTPIPVLEAALLSTEVDSEVTGTFEYSTQTLYVGDVLCIYEHTHPSNRDYVNFDYKDDSVAYVEVTAVNGTTIQFKSISDEDADKVIFIPDTIPFSVTELPTRESGSLDVHNYDTTAWLSVMGYQTAPEFNVGDFVVLYQGAFADMKEDTPVYFGEITAMNGDVISYKQTTSDAIVASQDLFLQNPVSGDELLENIDVAAIESQVEQQAIDSGFANEAALYLMSVAESTDGFQNMTLESMRFTSNGQMLSASQVRSIGGSWEIKDGVTVTAKVGKSSKYFTDGVSLSLGIDAEFTVDLGEGGDMKIELSATFVEEISVDIDVQANAKVKWYLFVPVFKSLSFGASVDLKNYSAISLDVKMYTVEKEEEGLWEKLKGYNSTFKEALEEAEELKEKITEAKETADKLLGYKEDLETLWNTIAQQSNGELTEDSYENILDTLGALNVTQEMMELLHLTDDAEIEAGVSDLMERYSEMLETESDWITLLEKEIFSQDINVAYIFAVGIDVDFVIKANVNIALGANMEYVVGKRYSFWIDIIEKTSGSSTMDLLDERFAFQFYVMGALGLKMGIRAEVKVGIISTKIGSIGVSAEFGPYVKLWGYFVYEYTKMRPMNTSTWNYDERMMGALYLEFGLYVELAFNAQVLNGTISYNPTLLDKEFPLLTAGNRRNYYDFGYEMDEDEIVLIEDSDKNSNTGITMTLPESYRMMKYLDLVEGNIEQEINDYSRFNVTLSNRNFQLDPQTGIISVNVPSGVQYMECALTLTWKMGKLEFSSKDISVTIPLVWTSLSTSELNQKYTASVKVGNAQDGYTTVWSSRVKKNTAFSLPTQSEILDLIGYDQYESSYGNLKYTSITGYGSQSTTDLAIYADTTYYFEVTPRVYTLNVAGVQDAFGTMSTKQYIAKYGEKFDLSDLYSSGACNEALGNFTAYQTTDAMYQGTDIIDGEKINHDISRIIDQSFAKNLLLGVTYTAQYVDNSATATFSFFGDGVSVPEQTVKVQKGKTPTINFNTLLADQDLIIKEIIPAFGEIVADTHFTVQCTKYIAPSFLVTYHTNGGTDIPSEEIKQGTILMTPITPIKTGYRFGGWYTDSEFKTAFSFVNAIMPDHALDFYAKWIGNEYQVTFDSNEGNLPEGTTNPLSVTYGSEYGTLPVPVRTGFKFLGWYTERTGGTLIQGSDKVSIVGNDTLYAHWSEKQVFNPNVITYEAGQTHAYNRESQPFVFSAGNIALDSFDVYYKRQSLDNEYTTEAVNAGTYDVKLVRKEDNTYKYFETVLSGVYSITKADSSITKAPTVEAIYYGNIVTGKMVSDVDYVGDGQLQFAASKYNIASYENQLNWQTGPNVYNIYDKEDVGPTLYLWVRLAEGENYKASAVKIATVPVAITQKPKSILNRDDLAYYFLVKTADKKSAGTDSKIYVALGNSGYQHLDNSGNDLEQGDLDSYSLNMDPLRLYNNCFGTIPVNFRFRKAGTASGWYCDWVRLDVYKVHIIGNLKFSKKIITGTEYSVDHWFAAEGYADDIDETYELPGYERNITGWDPFGGETDQLQLTANATDYHWTWATGTEQKPQISDQYCDEGEFYNPYEYLNAPELLVTFDQVKYNRFINQGIYEYTLDQAGLYQAMIADGISDLNLEVTLEFMPVNNNPSVTESSTKRTHSIHVTTQALLQAKQELDESVYTMALQKAVILDNRALKVNESLITSQGLNPTGSEDTFDVTYSLNENAGIWGTKFAVTYDPSKLELLSYTLGDVFAENEVTAPERFDHGRYVFLASRTSFDDVTNTGKLVTLHFKVKEGVSPGEINIALDNTVSHSINAHSNVVDTQLAATGIPNTHMVSLPYMQPGYTVSVVTGAAIVVSGNATVVSGSSLSIRVAINDGYQKGESYKVKSNDVELVGSDDLYTISNIISSQIVTVEGVEQIVAPTPIPTPTGFPVHDHVYPDTWTNNPSMHWKTCYCGDTIMASHSASDWIIDVEPTLSSKGSKHKECMECGWILETAVIDELKKEAPETKLLNSESELELMVLTKEEQERVALGEKAEVYLDVYDISDTISEEEKEKIQEALGDNVIGFYLDLTLMKKIGNEEPSKVTNPSGKIKIGIEVPEELRCNNDSVLRTYRIIQLHNGVPTVIEGTYDEKTGLFTFEVDAFSPYALIYQDTEYKVEWVEVITSMKLGEKKTISFVVEGYDVDEILWKTKKKDIVVVKKNQGKTEVVIKAKSVGTDTLYLQYGKDKLLSLKVVVKKK